MASRTSDTFYIRGKVAQPGSSYQQNEIDLGAFVNLGLPKSTLLRIHNLEVQISDTSAPIKGPIADGAIMNIGWQLTTQSQTASVQMDDKSVVATGRYEIQWKSSTYTLFAQDTRDVMPQSWAHGYLIGVDTLYLATESDQASDNDDYDVCVVLECTLETATQASSTALALSQQ